MASYFTSQKNFNKFILINLIMKKETFNLYAKIIKNNLKYLLIFTAQGCGKISYPNAKNKVVICEGG